MAGVDLLASGAGLDLAQTPGGTDLLADPNAPTGSFAKGVKSSTSGLKSTLAGTLALAGQVSGIEALKKYGLDKAQQYQDESSATGMRVEDIKGPGDALEFAKYGLGYAVPNLITSIISGALGRGAGALAARNLATPAKEMAKTFGMTAGLAGSSLAQEVGTIYPDAVQAGLPDAVARSVVGGAAAASLDLVPELLVAKVAGLLGKKAVIQSGAGAAGFVKSAAKGAAVGIPLEGGTEALQSYIERVSGGQPTSGPEAESDYLNSGVLGAIGGGAIGAVAGGVAHAPAAAPVAAPAQEIPPAGAPPVTTPAAPVGPTIPSLAEPEAAPSPLPQIVDPGIFGGHQIDSTNQPDGLQQHYRQFSDVEQKLQGVAGARAEIEARISALDAEKSLPPSKRRSKQDIATDRKTADAALAALDQHESNLKTLLETPEYQPKARTVEPIILGNEPVTQKAGSIITPQDDELMRSAEKSAQDVARVGNFTPSGPGPVAGTPDTLTHLALLKKQRGILLSAPEADAARAYERTAATPTTDTTGGTPREVIKTLSPQTRKDNFGNAYSRGVDDILGGLVTSGAMKDTTAKSVGMLLKRGVESALAQPTAEQASTVFNAAFDKALKGRILEQDKEAFRADLTARVTAALPQESTTTPDTPLRVANPIQRAGPQPMDGAQIRLFSRAAGLPATINPGPLAQAMAAHAANGGSSTNLVTGQNLSGASAYAVSPYKDREHVVSGQLTAAALHQYAKTNSDLLSDPSHALGTWYDHDSGKTFLDVSVTTPDMQTALRMARQANQLAIFDLRTATEIRLGHPLFDSAQVYNANNDMAPIAEIAYITVDPERMSRIANAYEALPVTDASPQTAAAYAALAAETEQQFQVASKAVTIEAWTKEGQPYANSSEMRQDVFANNHIWVFEGGEAHPYFTPEQNWKFRAVHDLYGHAKTGFEFGPRGETNATRAHAQMYSNVAIPALVTETIGQNSWVNFAPGHAEMAVADRPYAVQKASLLPETLWRPILAEPAMSRAAAAERQNNILGGRGRQVLDYLDLVIGSPRNLDVRLAHNVAGGVGSITFGKAKTVIELAVNAKDIMSLGAHEGYHYLEGRVLPRAERNVVRAAFDTGTPLFNTLLDRARAYDRANGTKLEDEIIAIPAEARAYGFEFWRRGELEVKGAVERVFNAIRMIVEKIKNYINGNGFTSYEDVFRAVEIGNYAQRETSGLRVTNEDHSYVESIEPDAIAGSNTLLHKSASNAKGRPAWIKSQGDLKKLRGIMRALVSEGDEAKDWYRRSAAAILRWADGDKGKAAKLASLVAMYSPRTPVGQDLRHAVQHYAQAEAGAKIDAGGTKFQAVYGSKIIDGTGHRDYADKYVLPGNPDTAPKVNSFFKNLMFQIDPVTYPKESQDATIDMWMSHIFGFGQKEGTLSAANYWWADAEIKKHARELGMDADQVQAAIWVSIKARGNAVRAAARKEGIKNGWFKMEAQNPRSDMFSPPEGGRVKYTLKKESESDYMVNWIRLALSIPFQKTDFDAANYSYAEAFRDIADGTVPLNRLDFDFELKAGMFDDIALGKYTDGALTFYSRAASLGEMAQRVDAGELQRTQLNDAWTEAVSRKDIPAELRDKFLGTAGTEYAGMVGSLKRALTQVQSGHNISRHSVGFKNVFNVLTTYAQRKNRLIADAVERQLSTWTTGDRQDKEAASAALLERTEKSHAAGSMEYQMLRSRLTTDQRKMFDQATSMIANRLDAEFKADAMTYRRLITDDEQYAEWYAERSTQVAQLKNDGYFPERRYGDHVVHGYVTGEDGRRVTAYYSQHEREADARSELAELKRVVGDEGLTFDYGYRYKADYDGSLSFAQFLDLANRQGINLTQAEKERVGKALIASDSTRRNRVFRRKDIAGYSQDGMRVLAEFGVTMANKVAYSELGEAVNDALAGREVQAQFTPSGEVQINTNTTNNLWDADGEQGGFYRNTANNTVDFVMSPREGSKLSRGLRLAASAQFLGGSAASALVNMTSLPMNTIPWLTQYTSYTDAAAKTLGAARLATKHLAAIKDLPTLLNQSIAMEGIDNVDGLRRGLQIAAQDGTILDTEIYQIMGLSRGQEYSMSGHVQKAVRAWMTPFRLAEQFNRVTTFIAAYNVAKNNGLDNDAAYKQAQGTVHSTQFRYDEANRPALARGDVGSLLFTFKTYPIFMLETLTHLAKENPKSAIYMMLSLAMMSGVEGLPFAEDFEDLIDTISQRLFGSAFNTKRALHNVLKTASEAVTGADLSSLFMHGAANELTGMSFASRVGLGNLIPGSRIGAADADYKRVMSDLLGPVGSVLQGVIGGADSLTRGQFVDAAKQALPLAGQNAIKGWQQWERGYAADTGDRKLVDVSGYDSFMQGLGFSSAAVNKAYDADRIDKQTSAFYNQVKLDISKDLIKAIRSGDETKVVDAVNLLEAWNKANPDMPISLSANGIKKQVQLAGMPLNQRTFKLLPKQLRQSSESALGLEP